jgi:hypothetical protein
MLVSLAIVSAEAAAPLPTQRAYIKPFNTQAEDAFGYAVALSGDTMIVGAPYEDSDAAGVNGVGNDPSEWFDTGAVYVFVRNGTNWIQQAYLKASNPRTGNLFGSAVAISGDTAVVGAISEDSNSRGVNGNENDTSAFRSGAAYVFVRNGTNWTQQAYLKASNTDVEDEFGCSVAISGDTIVVGARWESSGARGVNGDQENNDSLSSGAAYVFVRSGTNWEQQAYVKASNADPADEFGTSVSIDGDSVIIGSLRETSAAVGVNGNQDDNSLVAVGAAYVLVRNGTNWVQQAYLKPIPTGFPRNGAYFGSAVSIFGNTAVVGAEREKTIVGDSGGVFLFSRVGTNWSSETLLKAPYPVIGDGFGSSVALGTNVVMVGSPWENETGAAHIFERRGNAWLETDYIRPAAACGVGFTTSLALSGDTRVIGAPWDSRDPSGNLCDPNFSAAGATYVFSKPDGPLLFIVPDGRSGFLIRMHGVPGANYMLYRSASLPASFAESELLEEQVAPASGFVEFHDTSPPPSQSFYRAMSDP